MLERYILRCLEQYTAWDEKNVGSYEEIIYDITPEQLEDYTAFGYFVTCDTLIKGRWEVTISQKAIK